MLTILVYPHSIDGDSPVRAPVLLTREEFTARTLARHGGRCCVPGCVEPADAAHHVVERRLWPDGGYYLENGAALCAEHHFRAETTELSADDLRAWSGIELVHLPPQFVAGERIDKWGNYVLPNGRRYQGEMFHEEQVQKAMAAGGMLSLVSHHTKHPRTPHLPDSPGASADDRILPSIAHYEGRRVIMTEKRDGECTSLYADHIHARSLDSKHHESRDWVKAYWNAIRHDIPERWRVVGENLYARHSVAYDALPSWFEGYFIWNERNEALSWDDTLEWFDLIGSSAGASIRPVPVLYDGPFDMDHIESAWQDLLEQDRTAASTGSAPRQEREGYVIRIADGFRYRDFGMNVAKWVRPGHVTTSTHWMHAAIVPNGLARD